MAAGNGHTDILDIIVEHGEALAAELLTEALNHAGVMDEQQAAQWLRQHGAVWPAVLGHSEHEPWSDDMIV